MGSSPLSATKLAPVVLGSVSNPFETTKSAEQSGNPFLKAVPPKAQGNDEEMVQVQIPVAQDAHGAGCSHCMSNFIGQKVVTAKRGDVATLGQEAAGKALSGAKGKMLEQTRKHEEAHASTARAAGLSHGPIQVNEDGSGSVQIEVPEMPDIKEGDPGAQSKLQAFMKKAEGLKKAALAPLGIGDSPSGQDYKVAQTGEGLVAKAQAMMSKIGFGNGSNSKSVAAKPREPFSMKA